MNYSLSEDQRLWQATARAFAQEEMLPISLQRDAIDDPFAAIDWDIITKGSKLGFELCFRPADGRFTAMAIGALPP